MGRTTAEHEHLLDRFDDLLTLVYLYESELAGNPDLGRLQALAAEVADEASLTTNAALFPDQRTKRSVVTQVMNGLQSACRMKAPPPVTSVDVAWDGLPAVLSGLALRRIHAGQGEQLAGLLTVLVDRLDASFPTEAKPFVTREQVAAILRALRRGRYALFAGPIQVEILSGLAHQEFLAALDRSEAPLAAPGRAQELARKYMGQAESSFVEMVKDFFVQTMVAKLYPRARQLRLTIDRAYPWGALWQQPLAARDCLDLYARLNRSGAIRDAKCREMPMPGTGVPGTEFICWGIATVPRPAEPDREEAARLFFKSDDTDLRIGGKPVQKHAVMAVRYDRPLRDVELALRYFRNYLVHQRKRYCVDAGEALSAEEVALARLRDADLLNDAKEVRSVLHDKSSILGHLCSLMDLEMQRDPAYAQRSKKARMLTIGQWVHEAGFAFSGESVRKSCARSPVVIAALRARFASS